MSEIEEVEVKAAREHAEIASRTLTRMEDEIRALYDAHPDGLDAWTAARSDARLKAAQERASAHALTALSLAVSGAPGQGSLIDALDWLATTVRDR